MSLQDELNAAKAEVARLETEIAALPTEIKDKTEDELSKIWHAITSFFRGADKVPAPQPVAVPAAQPEAASSPTASGDAVPPPSA